MDDDNGMRYAHCDGHTDLCFDDIGKYIISCGSDGDIRLYDGFEDDDPESHHLGDSVSSVAFSNDVLYAAADDKFTVSAYSFPTIEFEEIIAQFNTSIYHVVCSKSGKFVACGGGDFLIKVFDTEHKTLSEFRKHEGPILSLSFDPNEKYLASSSCDGTVRLWLLSDQSCIKTLNLFKKSNDLCTSSTLCRMNWSPDGKFLAIPIETEIHFYARETWEVSFTLTDKCITKIISIVTYSPFGNYIAAASMNGQMVVWDMQKRRCVSKKPHEKEVAVCALKWNPSGKDLVFCDVEGQMGIYLNPLGTNLSQNKANKTSTSKAESFIDSFADEDDNMGEDDNGMDDLFDDDGLIDDGDANEDNAFDIGAIKASLEPKIFSEDVLETDSVKEEPVLEPKVQVIEAPKAPIQTAFQPSSTPVSLEHRFMLWNNVGIVRCYNTEEENSIDVEFHAASIYHPLHIVNTKNHTLAALSSEGLLLACHKVEGNTSKLECTMFDTYDRHKEWTIEMPEDEEIEAIALGEGFAVCITDQRLVRLISISGVQLEVFSLPGSIVSCSAKNNQLLIVYHSGIGIEGDQCLSIMIVKVKVGKPSTIIKDCIVALRPKAFLSWLGFTDEGKPCIVDTAGVISLLNISWGCKWIPIANTASNVKNKSDTYFVIGLSEIKQEIRYILCKGSRYPALLPRPTISVLRFALPFCDMGTEKGRLEESNQKYFLASKCLNTLAKEGFDLDSELTSLDKRWMDALLRMFALATRSERESRAIDVAQLMPNSKILQGAIRYATQLYRSTLADRVGEILSNMLSQVEENDEEFEPSPSEEFSDSIIGNTSTTDSFSLSLAKEENVLKPKPLSRVKIQIEKSVENLEESLDISGHDSLSISNLSFTPKTSSHSNPFKSNSKKEETNQQNGIDDILNNSMKSITAKNSTLEDKPKKSRFEIKKSSLQPSSTNTEKIKTGFNLYFEENEDDIKASEAPDISEKDLVKIAMKLYKELPKSEKQKYMKSSAVNKSNSIASFTEKSAESKENSCELQSNVKESSVKRKDSEVKDSEEIPKPKKLKLNAQTKPADSTLRKLTQYAFTKIQK